MPIYHQTHLRRVNSQEDAINHAPINGNPSQTPKPNQRSLLCFLLRSIIMALVIFLFLFFLGIAALVLLHFLLSSSASSLHRHRHRHHRRRSSSTDQSPSYTVQELQKFLPCFCYAVEKAKDCAICLECFKEGDLCRKLPACNHIFHMRCVDEWLIKTPNCPICRSPVQLYSDASSSVITNGDSKLLWVVNV